MKTDNSNTGKYPPTKTQLHCWACLRLLGTGWRSLECLTFNFYFKTFFYFISPRVECEEHPSLYLIMEVAPPQHIPFPLGMLTEIHEQKNIFKKYIYRYLNTYLQIFFHLISPHFFSTNEAGFLRNNVPGCQEPRFGWPGSGSCDNRATVWWHWAVFGLWLHSVTFKRSFPTQIRL